jgi:hypothetical protein
VGKKFALQDTILVVEQDGEVAVYSIANPEQPVELASTDIAPQHQLYFIDLQMPYLYLTTGYQTWEEEWWENRVYHLDFDNSNTLTAVFAELSNVVGKGRFIPLWNGFAVSAISSADGAGTLRLFATDGATAAELTGYYEAPWSLEVMDVRDERLLVREGYTGLAWYDFSLALAVEEPGRDDAIPTEASIAAIYPNPFNESVRIAYSLPKPGEMRLAVYDLLGREVALIREGHSPAGRMETQWRAGGLASGTYFLRLQQGDGLRDVKRVQLVK